MPLKLLERSLRIQTGKIFPGKIFRSWKDFATSHPPSEDAGQPISEPLQQPSNWTPIGFIENSEDKSPKPTR